MKSISVIIPVYNDGDYIKGVIEGVDKVFRENFKDYELLVFDDCSMDESGRVVDDLAKKNGRIRVFHNGKNMNVGYNFRMGIRLATKQYVMLLPGPNSLTMDSLEGYVKKVGRADVVTAYIANNESRRFYRFVVSFLATRTLNLLFGLRLKYFFGMQVYKTELVRTVKMSTDSFGVYPEILIQLVKRGCSVLEVPIVGLDERSSSTTAFRFKNVVGVVFVVAAVFFRLLHKEGSK